MSDERPVSHCSRPVEVTASGSQVREWVCSDHDHIHPRDAMIVPHPKVTEHLGVCADCGYEMVSDGFHTFGELYDHRRALTAALCRALLLVASPYRSRLHHDGTMIDGHFIVGLDFPGVGPISYHYELKHWHQFDHVPTLDRAPEWDGHTSADVGERLLSWAEQAP